MTRRLVLSLVGIVLVSVSPVMGQNRLRVVPFAGAHFIDGDRWLTPDLQSLNSETDSNPILGVRVDIPFHERWAVEASYGWTSFEQGVFGGTIEDPEAEIIHDDFQMHSIELGILWMPTPARNVSPFLVIASGFARVSFEESFLGLDGNPDVTKTEAAFAAGGGVVWRATSRIGVRFELRDHARFCRDLCDGPPETLHDFELSGGIAIDL